MSAPAPSKLTGNIIKSLREKQGLKQSEFGIKLAEFMNRRDDDGNLLPFSIMTVSQWECNSYLPPANTFLWIALYFGVTTDYLFGLSNDRFNSTQNNAESEEHDKLSYKISFLDLRKYDGKPVYINSYDGTEGYYIVDFLHNRLIGKDATFNISSTFNYYTSIPQADINIWIQEKKLLSLNQMIHSDYVMIESRSPDPYIRGQLSGIYHHYIVDGEKKFLIDERGNTLDYSGLGLAYNALSLK